MINILEIDPVLTVFPYALLYYSLLLASSGLALLSVYRSAKTGKQVLQTALLIIFVCQVILLTINLISYQGFHLFKAIFPLAHRLLNLICLLWLIWALFQIRNQFIHNWIPAALTVVILIAGVVLSLWWLPIAFEQDFNHSWLDYLWIGFTLALILVSGIYYFFKFRNHFVEALLILLISAGGFVLYLLLPSPGNLPATVMLSQVIYYPLLISLSSLTRQESLRESASDQAISEQNGHLRANIADAFLKISVQPSQDKLEKALTHSLSLYLMADLLGLLRYEPEGKQTILRNTYDLIREDHLKEISLDGKQIPVLLEKLVQGETLLSNRESELKAEKNYLMNSSGYNQIGNLLLYPLENTGNQSSWALLGLSPYTNKQWGLEDLQRLDRLQDSLSRVIEKADQLEQDARQISDLQAFLLQKEAEMSQLKSNYIESQAELQVLNNDLLQTQTAWTDEVNLWIERQKELETELEQLNQIIRENQKSIAEIELLRNQKKQLEETIARNSEQTTQLKTAIDQASLLLQRLTDQDETADHVEESKG